jgi:hypothetical protein
MCCADARWPSNGQCECVTSGIFCGVVPGYEPGTGGAPGEDACVCGIGLDPRSNAQVIGATCNSNGTTTAGPGLGICCMFSGAAPGSLGGLACVCAAGMHTCGTGGVQVTSCSVANFPPPAPGCDQGRTQVVKCM